MDLFATARARSCNVDVFVERVNEAGKLGLTWVDALAFAAERHKMPQTRSVSERAAEPAHNFPD